MIDEEIVNVEEAFERLERRAKRLVRLAELMAPEVILRNELDLCRKAIDVAVKAREEV